MFCLTVQCFALCPSRVGARSTAAPAMPMPPRWAALSASSLLANGHPSLRQCVQPPVARRNLEQPGGEVGMVKAEAWRCQAAAGITRPHGDATHRQLQPRHSAEEA